QNVALLVGSALLAMLALWVALRLSRGYLRALEGSLRNTAATLGSPAPADASMTLDITMLSVPIAKLSEPGGAPPLASAAGTTERERDLRPGDSRRVRRALADPAPLPTELVPNAISLLADDGLAPEVTRALRKAAPQAVVPLVAALLDPAQPVEV